MNTSILRYVVVTWPQSQELMDLPGFDEHSYLINDEHGLDDFGSSAFFVEEGWLNNVTNYKQ